MALVVVVVDPRLLAVPCLSIGARFVLVVHDKHHVTVAGIVSGCSRVHPSVRTESMAEYNGYHLSFDSQSAIGKSRVLF